VAKILKKAAETDLVVSVPDYECEYEENEGVEVATSCTTRGHTDIIDADTAGLDEGLPPFSLPIL
jgi:hypothetical protein